jgi:archaellum component FlaF (FlaF/FlaG flagellin family)
MPGYARPTTVVSATEILFTPTGSLSSTNVASALAELDSDVTATNSSVSSAVASKADVVANGTAIQNNTSITSDYTFPANRNAVSSGPITINTGVTVTISSGSEWSIV